MLTASLSKRMVMPISSVSFFLKSGFDVRFKYFFHISRISSDKSAKVRLSSAIES